MKIQTTKAAVLTKQKHPLVVDEVLLPADLEVGQVLVEIKFSTICGSQLGEIAGIKGEDPYLPHLLGHEGTGVVLSVGPGVSTVEVDDQVVLHWRSGSGIQGQPPKYRWKHGSVNAGFVTTFNHHAVVSENRVTVLPENYPLDLGCLFGCAVTTGLGVIENNACLKMGESIVIFGAGGVGLNIIQGAVLHTATPIVAIDKFDNRLSLAERMGATHTVNNYNNNIASCLDKVFSIVGVGGADVVVDNTGSPEIIEKCIEMTKPQGRTILVGVPPTGHKAEIFTLPLHFGKVLKGSHGGDGYPTDDIPRYIKLSETGLLDLKPLLTGIYSLDQINDAIDDMHSGRTAGRCLLDMSI